MIGNKKVVVVMPAYNAEKTLLETYQEIPMNIVDQVILVDDSSSDETVRVAEKLDLDIILHPENQGYGKNQKTCYDEALNQGADIIVMLHPDYQYPPQLITAMCQLIASGQFDVMLASRILGGKALKGGMPIYKYIANRVLTLIQNIFFGTKISEFHTGYRAFSSKVLRAVHYDSNSDDFVFDNQLLAQIIHKRFKIGEISCPTRYFPEASSINFFRSIIYGIGCLKVSFQFRLSRWGIIKTRLFHD
ncbi:MAG: glycosyltransferase family 2 protein [Cyclobacteriaceae bacterium]